VSWDHWFFDPIILPGGRELVTLRDAAQYIMKLPMSEHDAEEWEARDEKRLLRLQRQLSGYKLLIIDELGYVPLSQTGAELLFEVFSQRYERGSTVVTSNLPFDEWTSVFSSERLTGALLDRLTHHVHILEMNGDSYRLNQSKRRSRRASSDSPADNPTQA
jgi:IstB-like ATP binding protein